MASEDQLDIMIQELIKKYQAQKAEQEIQQNGQEECEPSQPFLNASSVLTIMGILTGVLSPVTYILTRTQQVILILFGTLGELPTLSSTQAQTETGTSTQISKDKSVEDSELSVEDNLAFEAVLKALINNYEDKNK